MHYAQTLSAYFLVPLPPKNAIGSAPAARDTFLQLPPMNLSQRSHGHRSQFQRVRTRVSKQSWKLSLKMRPQRTNRVYQVPSLVLAQVIA